MSEKADPPLINLSGVPKDLTASAFILIAKLCDSEMLLLR